MNFRNENAKCTEKRQAQDFQGAGILKYFKE